MRLRVLLLAALCSAALLAIPNSRGPGEVLAREALEYPFDSNQTWEIIRGYNCVGCNSHNPAGYPPYGVTDAMGLDLAKVGGGTAGQNVRAVFTGNIVSAAPSPGNAGCTLVLRGDDNRDFMYAHLAFNGSGGCSAVKSNPSQGDVIGYVWDGGAGWTQHMHVQWCDKDFAVCPNKSIDAVALNEGAFPFPSPGPTDRCTNNGEWCGYTLTSPPTPTPTPTPLPNPAMSADFDGDGKSEIAVWRPLNGEWHIRNEGQPIQYGALGDIPVPADYNGDGKAEIAVWRPLNGEWHIHDSGIVQYGASGDIPVPGLFTNTERTEIAVWRPLNGEWHIHESGIVQYGALGDVPLNGMLDYPSTPTPTPTSIAVGGIAEYAQPQSRASSSTRHSSTAGAFVIVGIVAAVGILFAGAFLYNRKRWPG